MSVALGVTWFHDLASRPDIIDLVDFIEVPGWLLSDDFQRPHERIVLHNLDQDWSMAAPGAIYPGWDARLREAITTTRTPWFSMHLGFSSELVRFDNHMLPASPPLDRHSLLERLVAVTSEARNHCPLQVLLENLDYCPEGAYEHVCDPGFIREVLERSSAGLLFDLAHWQVSASWLGYDPLEALNLIPLERAVEIHLSSPRPVEDGSGPLDDTHERLTARDIELFLAVLARVTPQAVTIEYRRDLNALREQVEEIRSILNACSGISAM